MVTIGALKADLRGCQQNSKQGTARAKALGELLKRVQLDLDPALNDGERIARNAEPLLKTYERIAKVTKSVDYDAMAGAIGAYIIKFVSIDTIKTWLAKHPRVKTLQQAMEIITEEPWHLQARYTDLTEALKCV